MVNDWVADADPQVRCLAVANHVLYAGGWFTDVGGEARSGLAAIDTETGAVLAWDPRPTTSVGIGRGPGYVYSLHVGGDVLYVGGGFDYLGLEERSGLAAVSLARGPDLGPFPDRPFSGGRPERSESRSNVDPRTVWTHRSRAGHALDLRPCRALHRDADARRGSVGRVSCGRGRGVGLAIRRVLLPPRRRRRRGGQEDGCCEVKCSEQEPVE